MNIKVLNVLNAVFEASILVYRRITAFSHIFLGMKVNNLMHQDSALPISIIFFNIFNRFWNVSCFNMLYSFYKGARKEGLYSVSVLANWQEKTQDYFDSVDI